MCLTTSCPPVDSLEEEGEEWETWVRPAICISIVVVAVFFFSFMYFGRSWLEGTVKVKQRYHSHPFVSPYSVLADLQKEPTRETEGRRTGR